MEADFELLRRCSHLESAKHISVYRSPWWLSYTIIDSHKITHVFGDSGEAKYSSQTWLSVPAFRHPCQASPANATVFAFCVSLLKMVFELFNFIFLILYYTHHSISFDIVAITIYHPNQEPKLQKRRKVIDKLERHSKSWKHDRR
jgi:hypothetical protein